MEGILWTSGSHGVLKIMGEAEYIWECINALFRHGQMYRICILGAVYDHFKSWRNILIGY